MILNPGAFAAEHFSEAPWIFSLSISGLSFSLLFFQTGLDRMRAGNMNLTEVSFSAFKGLLLGTVGIVLLSLTAYILMKLFGGAWEVGQTIKAMALSYSSSMVYMALGFIANLIFGWNTSVAFGVAGVIWTLGPLYSVFRNMSGNRILPSVSITTLCGAVALYGWYIFAAV